MIAKLRAWQPWMDKAVSAIDSGHYQSVAVIDSKCWEVRGEFSDGTTGCVLAKYSNQRTAEDVAGMINRKAGLVLV